MKDAFVPEKYRSTDYHRGPAPTMITDAESARRAALASTTVYCGWCPASWPESDTDAPRKHRCRDAAGRDLEPVKRAHAEGALRQLRALKNTPAPPCVVCGKTYPPGSSHDCSPPTGQMPHDVAAAKWQRAGMAQLAAEVAGKESSDAS